MILLGLDIALRTTGYGVVRVEGKRFTAMDCGIIRNAPKAPHSDCLRRLGGGVRQLVDRFQPAQGAVEGGFFGRNVRTAMVLGMARGTVVATLAEQQVPVYEYAPSRAKQAVVGRGNASKRDVALCLASLLQLNVGEIPDDATDALAVAICHARAAVTAGGLYLPEPV